LSRGMDAVRQVDGTGDWYSDPGATFRTSEGRVKGDRSGILQRGARRVKQVGLGCDAAEVHRFDEAVEESRDLGAAQRPGAVVIPASQNNRSQPAFGVIVIHGNTRIVQKALSPAHSPCR